MTFFSKECMLPERDGTSPAQIYTFEGVYEQRKCSHRERATLPAPQMSE